MAERDGVKQRFGRSGPCRRIRGGNAANPARCLDLPAVMWYDDVAAAAAHADTAESAAMRDFGAVTSAADCPLCFRRPRSQNEYAPVMELADMRDLGSRAAMRVGSSPFRRTRISKRYRCHWRKASGINRFRAFLAPNFTDFSIDANRPFRVTDGIRTPYYWWLATGNCLGALFEAAVFKKGAVFIQPNR